MFNADNMASKFISSDKDVIPKDASSSVSNANGIRPQTVPNARKQFKDVLKSKKDEASEDSVQDVAEDETPSVSVFDLSAKKGIADKMKEGNESSMQSHSDDASEDVSELASLDIVNSLTKTKLADQSSFAQEVPDISSIEPNTSVLQQVPIQPIITKEVPIQPSITKEVPIKPFASTNKDKSFVDEVDAANAQKNPSGDVSGALYVAPINLAEVAFATPNVKPTTSIKEIIDQIVDKIYTLETSGRSDTVIVFKQPPILNGAELTLTRYDTGGKDLNVMISNLTEQAKLLIDMKANQDSLKLALDKLGITVHIFMTTTVRDINISADASADGRAFREEDEGQQGDNREQKQKG